MPIKRLKTVHNIHILQVSARTRILQGHSESVASVLQLVGNLYAMCNF
jgi:hypothetical protein